MSKIKNGGLSQYGAEPFEQQQFGTAGVEWVKTNATGRHCDMAIITSRVSFISYHQSAASAGSSSALT